MNGTISVLSALIHSWLCSRYWENVGGPIDKSDDMWREASSVGGKYVGGYVAWKDLAKNGWNKDSASWHNATNVCD